MIMSGSLAFINAPSLFQYIENNRKTVTFSIRCPDGQRTFYFVDGKVVWASSEFPDEQLGEYLIESGTCTRDLLDEELRKSQEAGEPFTSWLVQQGKAGEKDLENAAGQLTRRIIFNTFRESRGEFEMDAGVPRQVAFGKIQLSPKNLVMEYFESMGQVAPFDVGSVESAGTEEDFSLADDLLLSRAIDRKAEVALFPDAVVQLMVQMLDPVVSTDRLAGILAANPDLGSRFLKAVNTPHFVAGRTLKSPGQAVALLGVRESAQIALALSVGCMRTHVRFQELRRRLNAESVRTAFFARDMAHCAGRDTEEYFLLGLLRRIGTLIALDIIEKNMAKTDIPPLERSPRFEAYLVAMEPAVAARWMHQVRLPELILDSLRRTVFVTEDSAHEDFRSTLMRLAFRASREIAFAGEDEAIHRALQGLSLRQDLALGEADAIRLVGKMLDSVQTAETLWSV